MAYKVRVQRQTVNGEMIEVETDINGVTEFRSKIAPIFDELDGRMIRLNQRVLKANQKLGLLTDEEHEKFRNIMLGMYGVVLPPRGPSGETGEDVEEAE